jgi:hypothetical protein
MLDKPSHVLTRDKRSVDYTKPQSGDKKLKAVRQYQRARGLCDRCAEKWNPGHRCATIVQLHAAQELWEMMSIDGQDPDALSPDRCFDSGHLCVCLSEVTVSGVESPRSMRIMGSIQGQSILILVDSASTHTFISSSVVQHLIGKSLLPRPLSVCVASGEKMAYQWQLQHAEWQAQGYTFNSNFIVLPL